MPEFQVAVVSEMLRRVPTPVDVFMFTTCKYFEPINTYASMVKYFRLSTTSRLMDPDWLALMDPPEVV
jgi:hypothetical protein